MCRGGLESTPAIVLNRSGMPRSVLPGSRAVVRLAYVVGVAARAVLVTPLSGALARFGKAGASALALWADRCGVSLEVIDAYPSAASAIRAAEASRPDVVFGSYGSGPALAAASEGVVWNHGGATARLAPGVSACRQRGVSRLPLSRRSARNPCRRRSW